MDIAALVVSVLALALSAWSLRKSHQLESKRLSKEEEWRNDDIAREFRAHQPQIEIEQFLRAGGPPDLPKEAMYLVVIAKNTGRIPITMESLAHFALADPEVSINTSDLSRPSAYRSQRDEPNWFSPDNFPLKLEPNEACSTFIGLDHITEHAEKLNAVVQPEEKYKACVGFYEDKLGRFYKPTYAVQFVPD